MGPIEQEDPEHGDGAAEVAGRDQLRARVAEELAALDLVGDLIADRRAAAQREDRP